MNREDVLNESLKIVMGARNEQYGSPEDCFNVIAGMWGSYLGVPLSSTDVAMLMVLLKVARSKANPKYADNYVDIAGYAACAGELND